MKHIKYFINGLKFIFPFVYCTTHFGILLGAGILPKDSHGMLVASILMFIPYIYLIGKEMHP